MLGRAVSPALQDLDKLQSRVPPCLSFGDGRRLLRGSHSAPFTATALRASLRMLAVGLLALATAASASPVQPAQVVFGGSGTLR